jgi:hypothetical protein
MRLPVQKSGSRRKAAQYVPFKGGDQDQQPDVSRQEALPSIQVSNPAINSSLPSLMMNPLESLMSNFKTMLNPTDSAPDNTLQDQLLLFKSDLQKIEGQQKELTKATEEAK